MTEIITIDRCPDCGAVAHHGALMGVSFPTVFSEELQANVPADAPCLRRAAHGPPETLRVRIVGDESEPKQFGDLGGAAPQPVRLQGGTVILSPVGCHNCGQAFWTESDNKRRLPPGLHPCPFCGVESEIAA